MIKEDNMSNGVGAFAAWVQQELDKQGLKQADIGRNGKVTSSAVSKMMLRGT